MTYAQKIMDERREYYTKGCMETLKSTVLAMKDLAAPADIAQRLGLSLEHVLKILNQED